MLKKQKQSSLNYNHRTARAGQDVILRKSKADQFPGMGVTISSYQQDQGRHRRGLHHKDNEQEPPKKKRFWKKINVKRSLLSLLVLVIAGGLFFSGRIIYDLHKAFGGSIFDVLSTSKLKGEDTGRVNILLAGDSSDDPGHAGADLTDSVLLLSIDTQNNTGFMLSIPRDLYVAIPSNGYSKINAAYEDGSKFSQSGYPNGGMGLLEKVVAQHFGVPIDYYALIDYQAFKQAVDAVGGIEVNVQSSDPRGLYDAYTHLRLPNGEVELDGQEALNLARARGDDSAGDISYGFPAGDFDRTMHQREMLTALKTKADTTSVLANPIKISDLFSALGDNIKSDLTLSDARTLYDITKKIPNSKIASLSLNSANGQDLLASYTDPYGGDDLVPAEGLDNYSDIQAFVAQHTSNNPLVQEDATVSVLNGTNVDGLASTYQSKLQADHINADQIGDADSADNATSQIINLSNGKDPATLRALEGIFGDNVTTSNAYSGEYASNFIVVVGNDKAPSN
jgi:LCP family protein required for cell wall assembly